MAKLLLEARGIEKSYALRRVLNIESFELYDGERVGLVGENGAGKSTFFKILAGEIDPDAGTVTRLSPISVIAQAGEQNEADFDPALRSEFGAQELREGAFRRGTHAAAYRGRAHDARARASGRRADHGSGRARGWSGWKSGLREYEGAIVLISHDRALLDALCTKIAQLEDGKLTLFPGNYTAYRAEVERRRDFQRFQYDSYREEQGRIKKMIQREVEFASQKQHLPSRMGNSEARLHKRAVTDVQGKIHQVRKQFESRLDRLDEVGRPARGPVHRDAPGRGFAHHEQDSGRNQGDESARRGQTSARGRVHEAERGHAHGAFGRQRLREIHAHRPDHFRNGRARAREPGREDGLVRPGSRIDARSLENRA